jgi:hypothetical protein
MQQDENESEAFEQPRDLLCTHHARIQRALAEIECCMQREDKDAGVDAVEALRRAQDSVELAFKAGQAMENRLMEYRTSIERLGFVRIKSKKEEISRR